MSSAPEIPMAPCPDCGCGLIPVAGGGTWCPQCNTTRSVNGSVLVRGSPRPDRSAGQTSLAKAGYVLALLVPIAGVVIAIVLFARDEVGPGIATLLLSFLSFAVAVALF